MSIDKKKYPLEPRVVKYLPVHEFIHQKKSNKMYVIGLRGGVELLINLLTGAFVTDLLGKNIKFNLLTCHFLKLTLNFFGCFLD